MESTNEIQSKIEEIQQAINRLIVVAEISSKRIEDGADLEGKTILELESLVQGSKSTNDESKQISLATQQQMTATSQVLTTLKEIQQSSVSMKQTQTVTSGLSESSKVLSKLVNEFKTKKVLKPPCFCIQI